MVEEGNRFAKGNVFDFDTAFCSLFEAKCSERLDATFSSCPLRHKLLLVFFGFLKDK